MASLIVGQWCVMVFWHQLGTRLVGRPGFESQCDNGLRSMCGKPGMARFQCCCLSALTMYGSCVGFEFHLTLLIVNNINKLHM